MPRRTPGFAQEQGRHSLFDEVGQLAVPVRDEWVSGWKAELRGENRPTLPASVSAASSSPIDNALHTAWLHVWVGEWEIAKHQDPDVALHHFRLAEQIAPVGSVARGLAAYDAAITLYRRGSYADARDALGTLLKHIQPGYASLNAALLRRHAAVCAGYHDSHAALGIPEPASLDPQCGAAGIAVCLREYGLPYDQKHVLAATPMTGLGSNLSDLIVACRRLGVNSYPIAAVGKAGLQALPKPLVAFVEHDHFIAVVHTDDHSVTYVCSDCGKWPGGRITLTWKQWSAMDAGMYLVVSKPGTPSALAMDALTKQLKSASPNGNYAVAHPNRIGTQIASRRMGEAGSIVSNGAAISAANRLLRQMSGQLFGQSASPAFTCVTYPASLQCASAVKCPMDTSNTPCAGTGDPVNLANGQEELSQASDISVYNPIGPSVQWNRGYYNLHSDPNHTSFSNDSFNNTDFGLGWTQPYNVSVDDPTGTVNPQYVPGGTYGPAWNSLPGAMVTTGTQWEVIQSDGQTVVATDLQPNGWQLNSSGNFTIPAATLNTVGLTIRSRIGNGTGNNNAVVFDVLQATCAPRGGYGEILANGTDAPSNGNLWEIWHNGNLVAYSNNFYAYSNGWSAAQPGLLQVVPPMDADMSGTYEVKAQNSPSNQPVTGLSGTFTVIPHRYQPQPGTRYFIEPNGARIPLIAYSVPTVSQPSVACSVAFGYPYVITWNYSASDRLGYYTILRADGSKWVTRTGGSAVVPFYVYNSFYKGAQLWSSTILSVPDHLSDRNGNSLVFKYGSDVLPDTMHQRTPSGIPFLAEICDQAGSPLLTIQRATNPSLADIITGVNDRYGRSVYYSSWSVNTSPFVYTGISSVSQVVPTGTVNPAFRWSYGYTVIASSSNVPFLTSITVPSAAGTGTSTATINYNQAPSYGVASTVDANGNTHTFSSESVFQVYSPNPEYSVTTFSTVTISDHSGNVCGSYQTMADAYMNEIYRTDLTGATVVTKYIYADPNDPYAPSTISDGCNRTWQYTHDVFGNVLTATDPRGVVTTNTIDYTHFPFGRLFSTQQGTKQPASFTYFEPSGLLATWTTVGPTGSGLSTVSGSYTYDGLGNVTSVTGPGNNASNPNATVTTTFNYTSDGSYSVPSASIGEPLVATDPLGHSTHLRYDSRGNVLAQWDALGNEYDATYNLDDQPLTTSAPATGQTGSGHSGAATTYLYTGGPVIQVNAYDEAGNSVRQTNFTYGAEGETLSQSGSTESASTTYDGLYRPVTLTDGNGHTTSYQYNAAGYPYKTIYPDGSYAQFTTYDASGRLTDALDPRGIETQYTYNDPAGALTDVTYPNYSALNAHDTLDTYGRVTAHTDASGSKTYVYDDLDTLTSVATTYTGLTGAQTISYTSYPNGLRKGMVTPAGSFAYNYDAAGRPSSLANPFSETTSFSYLNNDWLASQSGVVTASYGYDPLGRLLTLQNTVTSGGTVISSSTVPSTGGYDGVGNRLGLSGSLMRTSGSPTTGTFSWTYDSKDRVLTANRTLLTTSNETFAYDTAGNPTKFLTSGGTQTFNSDNQITQAVSGGTSFTFDAAGNPTNYGTNALTFDANSQLTSYGGTTVTNGYTSSGQRAWKQTANGVRLYFIYDGANPVVVFQTTNGANKLLAATYTFGPNGLISERGGSSTFYAFDERGNGIARVSPAGAVAESHVFDAYGTPNSTTSTDPYDGFGAQFGGYFDHETGLVLFGLRFYDAAQGRWVNRDPIGYAGGINVYAYCDDNPIMGADPLGLYNGGDAALDLTTELIFTTAGGLIGGGGGGLGGALVGLLGGPAAEITVPAFATGGAIAGANAGMATGAEWGLYAIAIRHGLMDGLMFSTSGGRPFIESDPYSPESVDARIKPAYEPNPAHDSKSPLYNPKKGVEPTDAESVYRTAVRGKMGTWYGKGKNGWYQYYSDANISKVHFAGVVPEEKVIGDIGKACPK